MGGSGGSGGWPGGSGGGSAGGGGLGGSEGSADPCSLSFNTNVFGPVPGVAEHLSVGDVLSVVLIGTVQPQVGVLTSAGLQAGSIGGARQLPTLIGCLQSGVEYEAEVTSVSGSNIGIRVRNS